eukprot:4459844-Amphidinium_carterae.1
MGAKLQRKTTLRNLLRKTCVVSETRCSDYGDFWNTTKGFLNTCLGAMVQGYFHTLRIEPMTSRMLSGCDSTRPLGQCPMLGISAVMVQTQNGSAHAQSFSFAVRHRFIGEMENTWCCPASDTIVVCGSSQCGVVV